MDHQYIGRADVHFTTADAQRGYSETRKHLAGYSDEDLMRGYLEAQRDSFGQLFGHNARKFGNLVIDELVIRNITSIPNLFGAISITPFLENGQKV